MNGYVWALLLAIIWGQLVEGQTSYTFSASALTPGTNTVNAVTTLTLTATVDTYTLIDGDTLTLTIPSTSYSRFNTLEPSACTSLIGTITLSACLVTATSVKFTMSLNSASGLQSMSFRLADFTNPYSTTPDTGFTLTLRNAGGTVLALDSTLSLSGPLLPDGLLAAYITPQSQLIAQAAQIIEVGLTIKNPLKPLTQIIMTFPFWNPDDGPATAKHHIQQVTPYCQPYEGMNVLMTCAYKIETRQLFLYTPVAAEVPGGTTLRFSVDNFLNPYNGKAKHGFTIVTTDAYGGLIDSSEISNLDITCTVGQWTTITSAVASRVDVMTTIREASVGAIEISLDIPVDPHCRIEIRFPTDMPLTSDLTQVSSTGILESPKVSPTHIDLSTNSFYLDGCSIYKSRIQNVLSMYKMMNKDCVKQTETFAVYLWALDPTHTTAYPIAKKEFGIYLYEADFSVGSVISLFVTAVDSYTI
jgi:hypothetical protein